MKIKQVTGVYFSPTERTKNVVEAIAAQIPGSHEYLDVTDAWQKRPEYTFGENEVVIVGVPVYGGRVPETAIERFQKIHGKDTPAILVVTYGNRAYEDALIELRDFLTNQGFRPMAAAAVVAEHSIIHSIAAGRPDGKDQDAIATFGAQAYEILSAIGSTYQLGHVVVKGSKPYRTYKKAPLKIRVSSICNRCGLCIKVCPVQAISQTDPKITDVDRCIICMRCIAACPTRGRTLNPFTMLLAGKKLKKVCGERKEPEFFF